ncbi:MAG: DUF4142 domain-containing protein [Panacagrimonas sp.]
MKFIHPKGAIVAICASISMVSLAQTPGPGQEKSVTVPNAESIPSAGQAAKQGGSELGGSPSTMTPGEADPKDRKQTDASFIEELDLTAMAALAQSRLASQRASDPQVKALSELLIADHAAMAPKLTSLASRLKADDMEQLDQARKTVVSRLEKLKGAEFDRAFVEQIVHDTDNTIAFYAMRSKETKDSDLRAFVSETLPVIERQRERATALYSKADKVSSGR